MSLLDANISRLNQHNNITLPPISSIIKSLDSQPSVNTHPINNGNKDTLITNNNNIPTLLPNDSFGSVSSTSSTTSSNHYTYHQTSNQGSSLPIRSTSADSLTSSPSQNHHHHGPPPFYQPIIQITPQYPPTSNAVAVHQVVPVPITSDNHYLQTPTNPSASASSLSPSLSPVASTSTTSTTSTSNTTVPGAKRKYTCKTCTKSFTTSGHLARHSRIHTGERKHVCPFPNCQSRFARQDNCMQHYKTHLNNKLRKRKYSKKA